MSDEFFAGEKRLADRLGFTPQMIKREHLYRKELKLGVATLHIYPHNNARPESIYIMIDLNLSESIPDWEGKAFRISDRQIGIHRTEYAFRRKGLEAEGAFDKLVEYIHSLDFDTELDLLNVERRDHLALVHRTATYFRVFLPSYPHLLNAYMRDGHVYFYGEPKARRVPLVSLRIHRDNDTVYVAEGTGRLVDPDHPQIGFVRASRVSPPIELLNDFGDNPYGRLGWDLPGDGESTLDLCWAAVEVLKDPSERGVIESRYENMKNRQIESAVRSLQALHRVAETRDLKDEETAGVIGAGAQTNSILVQLSIERAKEMQESKAKASKRLRSEFPKAHPQEIADKLAKIYERPPVWGIS